MNQSEAEKIASLKHHEGWHALLQVFTHTKERQFLQLARKLMAGDEVSPLTLAEKRGYFRGIEDMLGGPERAIAKLLKSMDDTD